MPARLDDIPAHDCISYRLTSAGAVYRWELQEDGEEQAIDVRGPYIVNDYPYALELARQGFGLAYAFIPICEVDLATERLVRVLPSADIEEPGLFLYYPQRSAQNPKLRALIDAARSISIASPPSPAPG